MTGVIERCIGAWNASPILVGRMMTFISTPAVTQTGNNSEKLEIHFVPFKIPLFVGPTLAGPMII
jgi:small neutral amino acid transporter SnatA (MarC family)